LLVTRFSSRANLNTFEFTVILVVGATGYLGGIITRSLLQQSHAVRITIRPRKDHRGVDLISDALPFASARRAKRNRIREIFQLVT
jgi:nucleoside-diphosphate-sugar epimerase